MLEQLKQKFAATVSDIALWRSYCHFLAKRLHHRHQRLFRVAFVFLTLSLALSMILFLGVYTSDFPTGMTVHDNSTRTQVTYQELPCQWQTWTVADTDFHFVVNCNASLE